MARCLDYLLRNANQLKLACLVHGGGQQELKSLLDFGRLGVEQGSKSLEFGGNIIICISHVKRSLRLSGQLP